jgi:hypothetical protein
VVVFYPLQHPLKNRTDEGWEEKKGKRAEKQAAQGFTGKIPVVENFCAVNDYLETSTKTKHAIAPCCKLSGHHKHSQSAA